jgi:hypothetical protein
MGKFTKEKSTIVILLLCIFLMIQVIFIGTVISMINIKKTIHLKGTYEDGHFSFTEDTNNNHQAVIEADLINN